MCCSGLCWVLNWLPMSDSVERKESVVRKKIIEVSSVTGTEGNWGRNSTL